MYLGIDIGTSSVKAVLVDDKDTVVEQASAPLNVSRPNPGWSEQNPADWWAATCAAVGTNGPAGFSSPQPASAGISRASASRPAPRPTPDR